MKAVTKIASAKRIITNAPESSPFLANSRVPPIAVGKPATIPANIINDIPLPIPRSVICSPNHIRNKVPVTNETTVVIRKPVPGYKAIV